MSPVALASAIGLSGFFGALVACAVFKWIYTWKGDVHVVLKWKDFPRCPHCNGSINTGPLLILAEDIRAEK